MEMCIHGMPKAYCEYCNGSTLQHKPASMPRRSNIEGRVEVGRNSYPYGKIVIIHSAAKGKVNYAELTPKTTKIHIHGYPFRHMLETIVGLCPNLKVIQMPSTMLKRMSGESVKFCEQHHIVLEPGFVHPETAERWKNNPTQSEDYLAHLQFMHNLTAFQRELFNELIQLGFEEAEMTARYFCLGGEELCSLVDLAKIFGYRSTRCPDISAKIRTILHFLGCDIHLNQESRRRLRVIEKKTLKLREMRNSEKWLEEFCVRTGIEHIPNRFPLSRLDELEVALKSLPSEPEQKRNHRILTYRLGLADGQYHTLEEVGKQFGLTRSRVRQIEIRVLTDLGVIE